MISNPDQSEEYTQYQEEILKRMRRRQHEREERESRRAFLGRLGRWTIAAAALAASPRLATAVLDNLTSVSPNAEASTAKAPSTPPEASPHAETKTVEVKFTENDRKQLNNILSLPLKSKERQGAEENYFLRVSELAKTNIAPPELLKFIDNGFLAVTDENLRAYLLDVRYKLRQEGCPNLKKLSQEEINWSLEQGLHPENLGVAIDARRDLLNKLRPFYEKNRDKFFSDFRPDIVTKVGVEQISKDEYGKIDLNDLFISAGGMAKLVSTESRIITNETLTVQGHTFKYAFAGKDYAFANIGRGTALEQTNKKNAGYLSSLVEATNKDSGFWFNPKNIPGSIPRESNLKGIAQQIITGGGTDVYGGAIGGSQIMPETAYLNYIYMKDTYGIEINPFSLMGATEMAYEITGRGEKVQYQNATGKPEVGIRYGYKDKSYPVTVGNQQKDLYEAMREASLYKWNAEEQQVRQIAAVDDLYQKTFGKAY